jgi:anti-sigma regulatory factor (Ser/Thr protein kinase)
MSPDDDPCTVVQMPFVAASAGRARRMMAGDLGHQAPSETLMDAELVLTELLTNALRHGQPSVDHEVEVGWCLLVGCVRVCVGDAGTTTEIAWDHAHPDSEGGRGMAIIDALCQTWNLELGEGSTRVVADIAIV